MKQTGVCFCSAAKSNNTFTQDQGSEPILDRKPASRSRCKLHTTWLTCEAHAVKKKAWGERFLSMMSWVKVVPWCPPSLSSSLSPSHHRLYIKERHTTRPSLICPVLLTALHSGLFLLILTPPWAKACSSYKVTSKECLKKPQRAVSAKKPLWLPPRRHRRHDEAGKMATAPSFIGPLPFKLS